MRANKAALKSPPVGLGIAPCGTTVPNFFLQAVCDVWQPSFQKIYITKKLKWPSNRESLGPTTISYRARRGVEDPTADVGKVHFLHGFSTGAFAQPRGVLGNLAIFFTFMVFKYFWCKNRLPEINTIFSFMGF